MAKQCCFEITWQGAAGNKRSRAAAVAKGKNPSVGAGIAANGKKTTVAQESDPVADPTTEKKSLSAKVAIEAKKARQRNREVTGVKVLRNLGV